MDEEELHLGLGNAAAQTLARAEAEAQAAEVGVLSLQPAGRLVLLRPGEHGGVSAHRKQPQLDQRLNTHTQETQARVYAV